MKNRHGMPLLDRPPDLATGRRVLVESPKPQTKTVHEGEAPTRLVLNLCGNGCKRWGHFLLNDQAWCECCISAEIVRSVR